MIEAPVAVIGGGAWGTALANAAAARGRPVVLLLREAAAARAVQQARENSRYLPGIRLADSVTATADPAALRNAGIVLLVVPAQAVRPALVELAAHLPPDVPPVICAKGIERGTDCFMSDVARDVLGRAPAILSGPSFAADVARGLPTAVTLAAGEPELAAELAAALSGPSLRVYFSTDIRGVEIGGAAKNVLAVAVGIVAGRGLGDSARAALTARGFAELLRFATAHGGRAETLMGLSGLGDLVLTCSSAQSRNFSLGLRIGAGAGLAEAAAGKLAEGALTAEALIERARQAGIEMPVCAAVAEVLAGRMSVDAAIEALMTRPLRAEH